VEIVKSGVKLNLLMPGTLPAFIAHLYGQLQLGIGTLQFVGGIPLKNPANVSQKVTVEVVIPAYSAVAKQTLDIGHGKTKTIKPGIVFDNTKLMALVEPAKSVFSVTVKAGGVDVASYSQPLIIPPKTTVFWKTFPLDINATDDFDYVATLVTPKSAPVQKFVADATKSSSYKSLNGLSYTTNPIKRTGDFYEAVSPGYYNSTPVYHEAGDPIQVSVSVTCFPCSDYNAEYHVATEAAFKAFASTGKFGSTLWSATTLGSASKALTAPKAGLYYHVLVNPSNNNSTRKYTITRTVGRDEIADAAMEALFDRLYDLGIVYQNVTDSFFKSSQTIKEPKDALKTGTANCIDGTLLMASALEAVGYQPGLVLVPGHAFLAVRIMPSLPNTWALLETTMINTGDFSKAQKAASQQFSKYNATGKLKIIDVKAQRDRGVTPLVL